MTELEGLNEVVPSTTSTTTSSTNATEELYHTNLLRLQATQLLSESILHLSSHTGLLENEVKWAKDVWEYIDTIKQSLTKISSTVLSPDDVRVVNNKKANDNNNDDTSKVCSTTIELLSDKAYKHYNSKEQKDQWNFTFPGGSSLEVTPIHSYAANGAGLTTCAANAHVIPTIDVAVLLPVHNDDDDDDNEGEEGEGMIGGKDYLNNRYFDKRNIMAIHTAKYLSQKKQRKNIGSVHITNDLDGDFRKVSLILTPPLPEEKKKETSSSSSNKKRKKSSNISEKEEKQMKKKKRIRFRIRLVFGVQQQQQQQTHHDGHDANTGWIPSARLFPNRCNNKFLPNNLKNQKTTTATTTSSTSRNATPTYNNALAMDLNYIKTTQILASTATTASKVFTEAWTLLKIWCLQRGFVRGHDTFSELSLGLTLAYLFRSRMISARMDSIQIVTVWMKFMSDLDWLGDQVDVKNEERVVGKDTIRHSSSQGYQELKFMATRGAKKRPGIVMPEGNMTEKQTILNCIQNRLFASDKKEESDGADLKAKTLLECYKLNTDSPVFLDPTMTVNYFANLAPSFIREMQTEARKALKYVHCHGDLNSNEPSTFIAEPFRNLFLDQVRFWRRYDAYVEIDLKQIQFPAFHSKSDHKKRILWGDDIHDIGTYESTSRALMRVLRMALGDRINAIRILTTGNSEVVNGSTQTQSTAKLEDIGTTELVDSDQRLMVPIRGNSEMNQHYSGRVISPVAKDREQDTKILIGMRINPNTCNRPVDKGPPADDIKATSDFVSLWGEEKAQLRRFRDGSIVRAVVWNDTQSDLTKHFVKYEGGDKVGDIVEVIIQHIIGHHFFAKKDEAELPKFALRDIASLVECAASSSNNDSETKDSISSHKAIMDSFESLSSFLKDNTTLIPSTLNAEGTSKLGLPLPIDSIEALSPSLRYSELFPPKPHVLLGGNAKNDGKKVSGVAMGTPILIQLRFEESSKWPSDINAMGAAKCAMLMQLAEGIEKMKENGNRSVSSFEGPMHVTPSHLDFGYNGYSWRVIVRADQELAMLKSLRNPSPEAILLRQTLSKKHVINAIHHFTIHGVHSKHSTSASVVRLVKRWIGVHMLSGLIPNEAIELLVASIFTNPSPLDTPSTVSCGFLRFLHLLFAHDWKRNPLIVDPEGHINSDERAHIISEFEAVRGEGFQNGPPMYIISPNDIENAWRPTFTKHHPEQVILARMCALAKMSHQFLMKNVFTNDSSSSRHDDKQAWMSVFRESPNSLMSYSCLLRVNTDLFIDNQCSTSGGDLCTTKNSKVIQTSFARSMEKRSLGPKLLRKKSYKNLNSNKARDSIMYCWNPVETVVKQLRSRFGQNAVFFYNEFTPEVIAMLWRPDAKLRQPFTAMNSEYKRPVEDDWQEDSLVMTNATDILQCIQHMARDVVVDVKVLNSLDVTASGTESVDTKKKKRKLHKGD